MKKITSTIAMAIMAMTVITLTSCEDVYISGELTGSDSKIWEGRISTYYEDRWGLTGDDYHTVIQFDSDDFRLTRGRGREVDYDVRNPYGSYWYSEFEWRVDKGVIELRYADTGFAPVYIYEYTLTDNYFSGYMDDGTKKDIMFKLFAINYFNWDSYFYNYAPRYSSPKMMPGNKNNTGGEKSKFGSKGKFVKVSERITE